jgi:hypothetical protein
MAQTTSTKSSDAPLVTPSAAGWRPAPPELELPDGSHFQSKRVRVGADRVLAYWAERLPGLLRRPEFWERRREERCFEEFDLTALDKVPVSYPSEFIDDLLRGH